MDALVERLRTVGEGGYPVEGMRWIAQAGLFGIGVPGGLEMSPAEQARVFAELARGSLTCAFVLTQHHVCATMIAAGRSPAARERWLPRFVRGEAQGANGINFLNLPPERAPMRARAAGGGWVLDGALPWTSAAARSHVLSAGAVLEDGRQLVAAVPLEAVEVDLPMRLLAVEGSETTSVRCREVWVSDQDVLFGPARAVLTLRSRATSFVATALTLGHARASLDVVRESGRAERVGEWLEGEVEAFAAALESALEGEAFAAIPRLRAWGNVLAARAAHLALVAGGGTAFRAGSAAERLYREAAFFSVWSVAGDVLAETLGRLTWRA